MIFFGVFGIRIAGAKRFPQFFCLPGATRLLLAQCAP